MKNLNKLLCLLLAALPFSAFGSDIFGDKINAIVSNNPSLQARKAALESEKLSVSAENNLSDPEVEFEQLWGDAGNKWTLSVSQSFDWPGLYAKRSQAAKTRSNAYKSLYEAELTDVRLRVADALADYISAKKRLKLTAEVKNNLDSIYALINRTYQHGETTILDMQKIRLEKLEAANRYDNAATALDVARNEIFRLNGGQYIDLDDLSEYPSVNLRDEDYYSDLYKKSDSRLAAYGYEAEAARQTAAAERMKSLPGLSVGYIHNSEFNEHFNGFKVGVSLPFFSNRHRVASAVENASALEKEALDYSLSVETRLRSEYAQAKRLNSRIADYNDIFGDTLDNYLALLNKSFNGGQMTLIIYLYEVNYYLESRLEYINLQNDYHTVLNSLNRF